MDESGTEKPRIKIPSKESRVSEPSRIAKNAGLPFWNALTPEMQAVIEQPIRRIEENIAKQFPDDYVSPLVVKSGSLKDQDGLEKQHDLTSCSYVATANALRLLDRPRPEYSRKALEDKAGELFRSPPTEIYRREIVSLLASTPTYDQFTLQGLPDSKVRLTASPEMTEVFRHIAQGDVGIAAWRQSPIRTIGAHGEGFISHARTIAGFSKAPDNSLQLYIIDPYGARQEIWAFRDWIAAMRMNILFDNPSYTPEEVRKWMENIDKRSGLMTNIAQDVILIHRRQRPLIILRKKTS